MLRLIKISGFTRLLVLLVLFSYVNDVLRIIAKQLYYLPLAR